MTIEDRDDAYLITHALATDTLSQLRDVETEQVAFRKGLVKLGRICGYEIIDGAMETEYVPVETPLEETTGERVKGLDDVVIINVLRAATPFVEGLLKAFPRAKQGVISAGRDEEAGMTEDGEFPITIDYVKLPEIRPEDTVIVASIGSATPVTGRSGRSNGLNFCDDGGTVPNPRDSDHNVAWNVSAQSTGTGKSPSTRDCKR